VDNLAILVIDLLSHITFAPEGGRDPEDTADLEIGSWQPLLNELSDQERDAVPRARLESTSRS